MVEAVLSVRRIPSSWLPPSDTAKQLQSNDAACIGDHRRLNVRLRLVIEELLAMLKALCWLALSVMGLLWPLLKVMVSSFVAEVVFTRLIPVHHCSV